MSALLLPSVRFHGTLREKERATTLVAANWLMELVYGPGRRHGRSIDMSNDLGRWGARQELLITSD